MSAPSLELQRRLAEYQPVLDADIAQRSVAVSSAPATRADNFDEAVPVDLDSVLSGDRRHRKRVVVAVAAVVVVATIGAVGVARSARDQQPVQPLSPATTPDDSVGTAPVGTATVDTAPPPTGATSPCPPDPGAVTPDTLYLGEPTPDQNLADPAFIFSLPASTPTADIAARMIGTAVVGSDCGLTATATSDPRTIVVETSPPTTPSPLVVDVQVDTIGDVAGVTRISSGIEFTTTAGTNPTLRLPNQVPSSVLSVRFRKGDAVWERRVDGPSAAPIELTVPDGEADPSPDATVSWVLFTFLDSSDRVVGVGGSML